MAHEGDAAGLGGLLEHGVDGSLEGGTLGGLRADVQQPHLRLGTAQHVLGVVGAHVGKLQQILRGTLGVGAAVDEHCAPVARRHHRSQSGPADALDALDQQGGRREQSSGRTSGDKGVPGSGFEQVQSHRQRGVLLLPEGIGRIVADLHHLRGVGDLHPGGQLLDAVALQHLKDFLPPAYQHDVHTVLLVGLDSSHYRSLRGVVPSHGVNDDFHKYPSFLESPGLVLLDSHPDRRGYNYVRFSPSRASKARLDSSAFLFLFPFTR